MKKFKVGASIILLIIICLLLKNFLLLLNYFLALVLHELAHLFVATNKGYKLKQMKLDMFGLSLSLDSQIEDKDAFAINIAGPLFNLILCVLCVVLYCIVPVSYRYINIFCFSNLCLAIFNLLPIFPLDGGKIFRSIFKSDKTYKRVDLILRLSLCFCLIILFALSCLKSANWLYLLMIIFLITSRERNNQNFSFLKNGRHKKFDKIVLIKAGDECTLYELLKQIKFTHYTIFYCNFSKSFLDEDKLIRLSSNYSITTKLREVC